MSESFAELFESSLEELELTPGTIVTGVVVDIDGDYVVVNAGLKSEGVIPKSQFLNDDGEFTLSLGDEVRVALEAVEDGYGATQLSREKAKRAEIWEVLEKSFEQGEIIEGMISGRVRGGFTVMVNALQAFLPGSLVDVRPLTDTSHLEGQNLEFKIVKLDSRRNNIVVSRRAVLEESYKAEREKLLSTIEEGVVLKGIVKNLTDYGAFIDLGGVDGLLHITDIAWKRVKHPSEMLSVGSEVDVKVLRYDQEKGRVSLGMKQLAEDPWTAMQKKLSPGSKTMARVTNLTDYGCFAEIAPGIEGLVHISEMDWTNKNVNPAKVVQIGQEVEVMILEIDERRRRISLGIKQCVENPWQAFSTQYAKGDTLKGTIRSVTDFGVFVGLEQGIDGLVHLSDLSWDLAGEEAVKAYSKGQEVETVVLSIDAENERIGLGIKQLSSDPFDAFVAVNTKGAAVEGVVTGCDEKVVQLKIDGQVDAIIKAADASRDNFVNLPEAFAEGDKVKAMIVNIDRRNRMINLSIKQLSLNEEKEAVQSVNQQTVDVSGPTTIGDLIKAQLDKSKG